MELNNLDIKKIQEHLANLEKEITIIKELIGISTEISSDNQIREIRERLIREGIDEDLVSLVGTIPIYDDDYKKDIYLAISEREKYKSEKSAC